MNNYIICAGITIDPLILFIILFNIFVQSTLLFGLLLLNLRFVNISYDLFDFSYRQFFVKNPLCKIVLFQPFLWMPDHHLPDR